MTSVSLQFDIFMTLEMLCCSSNSGDAHLEALKEHFGLKRKRDSKKTTCGHHRSRLDCALACGHTDCAVLCLSNDRPKTLWPRLRHVVLNNDLVSLEFMLTHLARNETFDINKIDNYEQNLLVSAILYGSTKTLSLLIAHGANFDKIDRNDHHAVLTTTTECAFPQRLENYKFILDVCGPTLRSEHQLCETVIRRWIGSVYHISRASRLCFMDLLFGHAGIDLNRHGFVIARSALTNINDSGVLEKLVQYGVPVHTLRDTNGDTLLHRIAFVFYSKSVHAKLLIKLGADVNARNDDHETPLHVAVIANHNVEYASFLLSHGADPDLVDDASRTPLELYCRMVNKSIEAIVADDPAKHPMYYTLVGGGYSTKGAAVH